MKRVLVILLTILALLVALPLVFGWLTLYRASGGLPEWDGAVSVPGLDGPVEIVRDEHGVPHVFASSEVDLVFAQGFIHAQDRLWQMLIARQQVAGRTAEWFGSSALAGDRFNRLQGHAGLADETFGSLPAATQALLRRYADGINAYMTSDAYRRPPELNVLHVDAEPWLPQHSLYVYGALYNRLVTPGAEVLRHRLALLAAHPRALESIQGFSGATIQTLRLQLVVPGDLRPCQSRAIRNHDQRRAVRPLPLAVL